AAGAFRVIRVNRPPLDGRDRVLDEARFVERVSMNGDLHVEAVGDAETAVDAGRRRAPIFVEFQTAGARPNLFLQGPRQTAVALTEEAEVDGQALGGLKHPLHIP